MRDCCCHGPSGKVNINTAAQYVGVPHRGIYGLEGGVFHYSRMQFIREWSHCVFGVLGLGRTGPIFVPHRTKDPQVLEESTRSAGDIC